MSSPWISRPADLGCVTSIEHLAGGDISANLCPGRDYRGSTWGSSGPTGSALLDTSGLTTTAFAGSVQNLRWRGRERPGGISPDRDWNWCPHGRSSFRDFKELSTTGFPSPKSSVLWPASKLRRTERRSLRHRHDTRRLSAVESCRVGSSRVAVTWPSESRKACRQAASPTGCATARRRAPCRAAPSIRSCSGIPIPSAPGRG